MGQQRGERPLRHDIDGVRHDEVCYDTALWSTDDCDRLLDRWTLAATGVRDGPVCPRCEEDEDWSFFLNGLVPPFTETALATAIANVWTPCVKHENGRGVTLQDVAGDNWAWGKKGWHRVRRPAASGGLPDVLPQ